MKHATVGMRREIEHLERKAADAKDHRAAALRLAWMKSLYADLKREPMRWAA